MAQKMIFPMVLAGGECSLCHDWARDCSCTECPDCGRGFIDGDEECAYCWDYD